MMTYKRSALSITVAAMLVTGSALADLKPERTVLPNDDSSAYARVDAEFNQPASGDLYLATQVNGQFLFFTRNGITNNVEPLSRNGKYSGSVRVLDLPVQGVAPGRYPVYQVVTFPDADPFDFRNWIGGPGGLNVVNFQIGLPQSITGDFDNDGFPDDDANRDGFYDDDADKDGFHDDDADKDGFHDDDADKDGFHDADEDGNGGQLGFEDSDIDGIDFGDSGDSGNITPPPPNGTPVTPDQITAGRAIYEQNCQNSGCHRHGDNPRQNMNGVLGARNPATARAAINRNTGGMGYLNNLLTDADLQAIADYLNNI